MQQSLTHTPLRGPALIRQLARLASVEVAAPEQGLAEKLSQWIEWNHAVSLSTALDAAPIAAPSPANSLGPAGSRTEAKPAELIRQLRLRLSETIAKDPAFQTSQAPGPAPGSIPDAEFFSQRYQALQQLLEAGVGRLRERLRAQLTARGGEPARLAAVDALLEPILLKRERAALATIPPLLARHFEHLYKDSNELTAFLSEMRQLLLAELDVRLQPVQGLCAALGTRQPGRYVQETA